MNYKHAQLNEQKEVIGISILHNIEQEYPDLIYIPEDNQAYDKVDFMWRYISNTWHEPLPPSEEELITKEIQKINNQLHQMYDEEQYNAWLGISNVTTMTFNTGPNTKELLIQKLQELNKRLEELQSI